MLKNVIELMSGFSTVFCVNYEVYYGVKLDSKVVVELNDSWCLDSLICLLVNSGYSIVDRGDRSVLIVKIQ